MYYAHYLSSLVLQPSLIDCNVLVSGLHRKPRRAPRRAASTPRWSVSPPWPERDRASSICGRRDPSKGAHSMTRSALGTSVVSRRRFLTTTGVAAAGATLLARAPAALGQQVRELNVWHTEVEPQTVKTIQDTSIAEFERKFPG